MNFRSVSRSVTCLIAAFSLSLGQSHGQNLLRNGSFEGSTKYWMFPASEYWITNSPALSDQVPAFGKNSLFLAKDSLLSTPFPLVADKPVRITFSARSKSPGQEIVVQVRPSKRDNGQNVRYKPQFVKELTTDWKRYSFLFTPDQQQESNWLLSLSGKEIWVDGVSVEPDAGERPTYVPRRAVEVAADWTKKDTFKEDGNLVAQGSVQPIVASVSNPGAAPQNVKVRWQMMDYSGTRTIGEAIEKSAAIPPGEVVQLTADLTAAEKGLMLARVSAVDAAGTILDSSDQPITVLPFPKSASAPDWKERIGCSLGGGPTVEFGRLIGFRWCRWWWGAAPDGMGWNQVQKDNANQWAWPDEKIQMLADKGYALNYVLYDLPAWAKAETPEVSKHLPKDMQWKGDDPRWDDLSTQTAFDKYVTAAVTRYKGKAIAWEAINEPEIHDGGFEPDLYFQLVKRMNRLVKGADPDAFFLVGSTWGNTPQFQVDFVNRGGAKLIDGYSWHNYGTGPMGDRKMIRTMKTLLTSGGNEKAEIWFNEGGTFANSSQDYAAQIIAPPTPAEWAHLTTRSMAEMFSAGADKHILFHISYPANGRSWYDWLTNGGAHIWDEFNQPTVGVPVWNVVIDSLGLSDNVKRIRGDGFELHVFQDNRNKRGVVVAFATGKGAARTITLPMANVIRRDVMGNDLPLKAENGATTFELPADGCPFYFFTSDNLPGADLAEKLAALGS